MTGTDQSRPAEGTELGISFRGRLREKLEAWYKASRPPYYIATLVPLTLGLVLAEKVTGEWRPVRFLLVNLGAFMIHLAANLANDLFDHVLGADSGESIGGSRVIQEGLISPAALAKALVFLFSGALITTVILVHLSGQNIIWALAVFSGLSCLFYVAPPIKYGYHGLGEVSVFINMGLIMVGGTFIVQAETWRWEVLLYAVPVGLMVSNILYFQSLPDMVTDKRAGKYTLAVRLGRSGARKVFIAWWAATWACLIGLNLIGLAGRPVWLTLASIPIFLRVVRLLKTAPDWVELDAHGHLIRKLYLINGILLIIASY